MAVRFTEAKVGKHGIAGILEAQAATPTLVNIFFLFPFSHLMIPVQVLMLIIDCHPHEWIWNRQILQEMHNQHKSCVILGCLLEYLHAHFFRSDFFPPRVNFLLTYTPAPVGNSLSWTLSTSRFPFMNGLFTGLLVTLFAFLSCRNIQPFPSSCLLFPANYYIKLSSMKRSYFFPILQLLFGHILIELTYF